MKINLVARVLTLGVSWLLFLAGGCPPAFAQPVAYVIQNFDGNICGWNSSQPVTLTFDPTQYTGEFSSGSCYVSDNLAEAGIFNIDASYVSCCDCALGVLLMLDNYGSVEFDLKWDTTSTVTPAQFNTGPAGSVGGLNISGCLNPVLIPAAATNGWVHITVPINAAASYATNPSVALGFTSTFSDPGTGKAAFWIDNVGLGVLAPQLLPAASSRGSNSFNLQWSAVAGAIYTVLKSSNLINWTILATNYPTGGVTNSVGTFTDTNATNPQSYYLLSRP